MKTYTAKILHEGASSNFTASIELGHERGPIVCSCKTCGGTRTMDCAERNAKNRETGEKFIDFLIYECGSMPILEGMIRKLVTAYPMTTERIMKEEEI